MNPDICAVFLCNKSFLKKFKYTCNLLITSGNYIGDICLVIGDDLNNDDIFNDEFIKNNNIIVQYFPNIQFSNEFLEIQEKMQRSSHWFIKRFQFHKLHLFSLFFKKWDYIFYLDCGITIFSDVTPILNEITENTLLAHSASNYESKLISQFDKNNEQYFPILNEKYNLDVDYFQSAMMLYDTKIIQNDTFDNLVNLLLEYPISITNDQGIISLYFTNIQPVFKQIKISNDDTFFYDFLSRNSDNKYIMLKYI